ncbi:ral guanine nucleotide dissociation stimulator-like 2 [Eudromia elegans]
MLPRALRSLLEGTPPPRAGPGQEPGGVVLSGYRPRLPAPARGDAAFGAAFLATYRAFAAPADVLRLLLRRLEEVGALRSGPSTPEAAEAQGALSALLCAWLEGHPEDLGVALGTPLGRRLVAALAPGSEAARRLEATGVPACPPPAVSPPEDEDGDGDGDAEPLDILGFQAQEVAEELTLTEAELFMRLVPYECLGSLWSRRARKGREDACPSVRATVRQFNRVAGAVVTSCLAGPELRPPQRARLLEKWIRVAEECHALRNFSSLRAIVSALQSSPVHRLKRTWDETARDAQRSYEELSAVCSQQDNCSASHQLLLQESPQRASATESTQRRQPRRPQEQRPLGVVPYLGTFLRDLVMLDAAMKDELENGYINFEKRRKEFQVLAQLRLLQASCRRYRLRPAPRVRRWLRALRPLSEAQSHSVSCEIEPPGEPPPRPPKPSLVITHCTELLTSVGTPSVTWEQPRPPAEATVTPPSPGHLLSRLAQHVKWPSVSALDEAAAPATLSPPAAGVTGVPTRGHRRSASCGSAVPNVSPSECRIIRARMELHNGSLYKSILITSQDKTPAVVAKVLEKHGQDGQDAGRFQLVQLLPGERELLLPPSANVFYAMTGASLDFALRPRPPARGTAPDLSATFPKAKATGRKLSRALF